MSILYESKQEFHIPHSTFNIEFFAPQKTLGGYCGGVPPLPIPNREVKPACADGTAMQCGRVGGCLLLLGSSRSNDFGDLFYCLYISIIPANHSCLRAFQMCADVVCGVGFKMPIACLDVLLALFGKMLAFCKSAYCSLCQHN